MGRVVGEADGDFRGFRAVGIVGLGLIGGSLALAIRERWPETVVVGVDRPEVLAEAVARGVIARGAPRAGALAADDLALDLVVLAAPVLQNEACLRELIAAAPTRPLLVTDVGSTKLSIVDAYRDVIRASRADNIAPRIDTVASRADRIASHDDSVASRADSVAIRDDKYQYLTFVGGHPIAGGAHGGLQHARADLFRDRPWLFTPGAAETSETTETTALEKLQRFVRALGAETATLDAAEHDRIMAYVSHLPQLAASALMRVAGENVGAPGFALSGAGLADTTRLASSPATMWTEILQSNAGHVRLALDAFITDLQAIRDQLTAPAAGEWLDAGARWRARLVSGAPPVRID